MWCLAFVVAQAAAAAAAAAAASIAAWPFPSYYDQSISEDFSLTVASINVPVISNIQYAHANFDVLSDTSITATITVLNNAAIQNVRISPEKHNLKPSISGNSVSITFPHDGYYIVKIDQKPELLILADRKDEYIPSPSGKGIYNVASLGATDATDSIKNTEAFQQAIDWASGNYSVLKQDAAFEHSRGIVFVPRGLYHLRNVLLQSNVALYLAPGAVLRFTAVKDHYRLQSHKSSQGRDITWWISTAYDSENIKVFGRGMVDGNGHEAFHEGGIGNNLLVPIRTKNFELDGITFRNSASWAVIPTAVENGMFRNFKVLNRRDMGENDAVDVMHSTNVVVRHAIGVAFDDPFSVKTWKRNPGSKEITMSWPEGTDREQKNVLFEDCISWTGCFGYKTGAGFFQKQENITFKDSVVYDAAVGIGIAHEYGTAEAANINFENIDIEMTSHNLVGRSAWLNMFVRDGKNIGRGGPIKDVQIKDITVRRPSLEKAELKGMDSNSGGIYDVVFKNVVMPGQKEAAKDLKELNITSPEFADGLRVER